MISLSRLIPLTTSGRRLIMDRTYENAIALLLARRRGSRQLLDQSPSHPPSIQPVKSSFKGRPSLFGMSYWLRCLGHSDSDINGLNIIHIAGTKGKGSTCAFVDSFLRSYSLRNGLLWKVGLYTSPHLLSPEERIRINYLPVSRDLFTKYFFDVYDCLNKHPIHENGFDYPKTLQLIALMSFHTFIKEGVNVAVYETHHGGEYDITNVIQKPVITAITTLGIDHIRQLGPTIEDITWHKAGIMKPGAKAFSLLQDKEGVNQVLRDRACQKQTELKFIGIDKRLPLEAPQLQAPVQRMNCSLALAIVDAFIKEKALQNSLTRQDITEGISRFLWPGRFETIVDGKIRWYLDGAHNELSMQAVTEWFAGVSSTSKTTPVTRVLLFSHISEERDGPAVIRQLAHSMDQNRLAFHFAIFPTTRGPSTIPLFTGSGSHSSTDQSRDIISAWMLANREAKTITAASFKEGIENAKRLATEHGETHVLVTGSQSLVGEVLSLLKSMRSLAELHD
ncbi:folylpolyglutamate synthase [Venturia nashicola]|uniref:tetrahydrofolate synthase n=1 Tax=Venturia nashicola TaxID=86259 RepID=A0A4Z1PJI0_9PEZI|nr:folylpolyglutamate synthase [Venturia nashicola]